MLDDETKMLAHQQGALRIKAILICQNALNEVPELFMKTLAQLTAARYAMSNAIV
jgi:hypothetical protein